MLPPPFCLSLKETAPGTRYQVPGTRRDQLVMPVLCTHHRPSVCCVGLLAPCRYDKEQGTVRQAMGAMRAQTEEQRAATAESQRWLGRAQQAQQLVARAETALGALHECAQRARGVMNTLQRLMPPQPKMLRLAGGSGRDAAAVQLRGSAGDVAMLQLQVADLRRVVTRAEGLLDRCREAGALGPRRDMVSQSPQGPSRAAAGTGSRPAGPAAVPGPAGMPSTQRPAWLLGEEARPQQLGSPNRPGPGGESSSRAGAAAGLPSASPSPGSGTGGQGVMFRTVSPPVQLSLSATAHCSTAAAVCHSGAISAVTFEASRDV